MRCSLNTYLPSFLQNIRCRGGVGGVQWPHSRLHSTQTYSNGKASPANSSTTIRWTGSDFFRSSPPKTSFALHRFLLRFGIRLSKSRIDENDATFFGCALCDVNGVSLLTLMANHFSYCRVRNMFSLWKSYAGAYSSCRFDEADPDEVFFPFLHLK